MNKKIQSLTLAGGIVAALAFAGTADAAMVLNLRGDAGVTTNVNGVTDWADQSGNSQDYTVGTLDGANNPDVGATLNGLDTVSFTSASSDLVIRNGDVGSGTPSGYPTLASDFHGFAVIRVSADQSVAEGTFFSWGPSQPTPMFHVGVSGGAGGSPFLARSGVVDKVTVASTLSYNQGYIVEFYGDGDGVSSSDVGISLDGGAFVTDTFGGLNTTAITRSAVGHLPASALLYNGDVAEIILYDNLLTETERNAVGVELENRWGIDAAYTAIPEPASLGLIGMGLTLIASRRRA